MAAAGTSKFARFLNSETGPKTIHFWVSKREDNGERKMCD